MTTIRRALLPLTADPVTNGHLFLIREAAGRADEVVVAILDNDLKCGRHLFSLPERLAFLETAAARLSLKNIRVIAAPGRLLADVYLAEGCDAVIRGARSDVERALEQDQIRLHSMILPNLADRFLFLTGDRVLQDVSSSVIKAFASHHVDVSDYVPLPVKQALEERLCGQWKVGLAGPMGSGKSWVARKLVERLPLLTGLPCHHLSYDDLVHELYAEQSAGAELVRAELAELLGADVRNDDGTINREAIGARLFDESCGQATRERVHALVAPHVFRLERERLRDMRGVVLVECATLADMGLERRVNDNVIVVDAPERAAQLAARGVTPERATAVGKYQTDANNTVSLLERSVERDGHGTVLRYVNRRRENAAKADADIDHLCRAVANLFPTLPARETP